MIPPSEAHKHILNPIQVLPEPFCRDGDSSTGCKVIAGLVPSDRDIPEGNLSCMDGFALAAPLAVGKNLRSIAEIPVGSVAGKPITNGQAVRIYADSVLPTDAHAVVEQEATAWDKHSAGVEIHREVKVGGNVILAGPGCPMLEAGPCVQFRPWRALW